MDSKVSIVLSNGRIFEGYSFGAQLESIGEIVFTTGMCGYMETLTDPSYCGQIVVQTFPLIGNYGTIPEDAQSDGCTLKGYVVREWCSEPSNFRSQGNIDAYLKAKGIPGVYGVDTRELTRVIREDGVMNAVITAHPENADMSKIKEYSITHPVKTVSSKCWQSFLPEKECQYHVALIDYGTQKNIIQELLKRGCQVTLFPYNVAAEDVLAQAPDGIVLSNGPGDPAENADAIEEIKKMIGKLPIFGIALGHQLLALACGGKTSKLKYGHRGANQPVRCKLTDKVYITNQNHGYVVLSDSIKDMGAQECFVNANDGTCEGIDYPDKRAFSVQFYPDGSSNSGYTGFLFDRFISMMRGE